MIKNVAEIELPMHACRLSCRTGISICIITSNTSFCRMCTFLRVSKYFLRINHDKNIHKKQQNRDMLVLLVTVMSIPVKYLLFLYHL